MSELQKNQEIERQPETEKSNFLEIKKQLAALLAAIWIWVSGAVDNVGKVIIPSAYGAEVKTYKQIEDKLKNLQPWHFLIVELSPNELEKIKKDLWSWYKFITLNDWKVKIEKLKKESDEEDPLAGLDFETLTNLTPEEQEKWTGVSERIIKVKKKELEAKKRELEAKKRELAQAERIAKMNPTREIEAVVYKFRDLFKKKKYNEIISLLKQAYRANNLDSSYVEKSTWEIIFWPDKKWGYWKVFIDMVQDRLNNITDKTEKQKLKEILDLLRKIRNIVKFKEYNLA